MQLCLDGNTAAAMSAYKLTDLCSIYPITPSSTMADMVEQWEAQSKLNLFGNIPVVSQANSELGAAACLHGAAAAGSFPTTFTSSQGLLLMLPNLYFISQQHLPSVVHLACRSIGGSSTTLSPDHSDVYALQNTSMTIMGSRNVQEAHDLAAIAHCAAIEASAAITHFFEGFRVSHQFETFKPISDDEYKQIFNVEKYGKFKELGVNPSKPDARGIGIGPELFYAVTEAQTNYFNGIPDKIANVMKNFEKVTGRKYEPFEYYGDANAEKIIIMMGCSALTVEGVIENMENVGLINIRLWKPFSVDYFISKLPASVKKIAILDRSRDFVSTAEPIFKEVLSALFQSNRLSQISTIKNCTYGIIGHDLTPIEIISTYLALDDPQSPSKLRIGVLDNLTPNSLKIQKSIQLSTPKNQKQLILYGIGADGTIGAARSAMQILNNRKPQQMQANFEFDGKKSGGLTISYLRFGPDRITSQYNPTDADYLACHCPSYVDKFDLIKSIKNGGTFMLNSEISAQQIPAEYKRQIAQKGIKLFVADCNKIAEEVGLGNRISTVTVMFLLIVGMGGLLESEQCVDDMKQMARKQFSKKSEQVIQSNMEAIEKAGQMVFECQYVYDQEQWLNAVEGDEIKVKYGPKPEGLMAEGEVYDKVAKRQFDQISTADVEQFTRGVYPAGYSKYEKPGVSNNVASWESNKCIQCNLCATSCPHACIRPFLAEEPKEEYIPAKGKPGQSFKIQISPLDCRGCGICVDTCPTDCLSLKDLNVEVVKQQKNWDDAFETLIDAVKVDTESCSLKELQFSHPYLFNPGSCPGCPETSLIRLLTTLFGKRLVIASAVGCCLVWGHYNQFRPYFADSDGMGPALATSAFEDNAFFGYGILLADTAARNNAKNMIIQQLPSQPQKIQQVMQNYLDTFDQGMLSIDSSNKLISEIAGSTIAPLFTPYIPYLIKRSHWIIGGDGWAFDIDQAGVDHVMSTNQKIRILVMNNNCYANTGGQYSKATIKGATAKHATNGVHSEQKQLALQLLMYKNCYVAQIAMGADRNQTLKALREAEAFDGPAFVVSYCPCIAHGIIGGLRNSEKQQKNAVKSGVWPLFRSSNGKLVLDSKKTIDVETFISQEQRFQIVKTKSEEQYIAMRQSIEEDVERVQKILNGMKADN